MLARVKKALRISTTIYDDEILDLIAAGIVDLQHAGPQFEYTFTGSDYTIADALASRAVVTYCRANFGSPENYEQLKASYDEQKAQMRESSAYGMEVL